MNIDRESIKCKFYSFFSFLDCYRKKPSLGFHAKLSPFFTP